VIAKVLIAVTALSCAGLGAADAAYKHKRDRVVRHHAPIVHVAPADPYAAFYHHGPKPPWGAPQQCFTDQGYGRFWPCGAGPSSIH
jgi:hypothetical protein